MTPEILQSVQQGTSPGWESLGDGSLDTVGGDGAQGSTAAGQETVTVIGGISAPASDFIFPFSSQRLITDSDLTVLQADTVEERHYKSQLAINEILARYGYVFDPSLGGSALEAYQKFEGKDWYEAAKPYCPSTSSTEMLYTYITELELENVDIICQWQQENGCYY